MNYMIYSFQPLNMGHAFNSISLEKRLEEKKIPKWHYKDAISWTQSMEIYLWQVTCFLKVMTLEKNEAEI